MRPAPLRENAEMYFMMFPLFKVLGAAFSICTPSGSDIQARPAIRRIVELDAANKIILAADMMIFSGPCIV
jgi:hypothetical protein